MAPPVAVNGLQDLFAERLNGAVGRALRALAAPNPAPNPNQQQQSKLASLGVLPTVKPMTTAECRRRVPPSFRCAFKWSEHEKRQFAPLGGIKHEWEILSNPILRREAYEPLSNGHEIVRQMRLDINNFTQIKPTDFQRELVEFVIELAAARIYGREWKTNQLAIKRYNNWTGVFHGIGAVMTGRKEGKSTGLALAAALIMFNIPRVRIALFSKTQAQAGIILGMAKDLLANHARSTQFKLDGNKEVNSIRHMETGDFRVVTAYSGSADVSFFLFFCFKIFGKTGESTLFVFVVSV